jgi:hypothetical protein
MTTVKGKMSSELAFDRLLNSMEVRFSLQPLSTVAIVKTEGDFSAEAKTRYRTGQMTVQGDGHFHQFGHEVLCRDIREE